jgi:hypothetical protein
MRLGEQIDKTLLRQASKVADEIRAGFRASIPNVERVVQDFLNTFPVGTEVTTAQARAWVKTHVKLDNRRLSIALDMTHATGYVLGQDFARAAYADARQMAGRRLKAGTPGLNVSSGYWDSWSPGNRAAAALVDKPGGLSRLLDRQPREDLLRGVDNTTLDRIGTRLADGLTDGLADGAIARSLTDVLGDPTRALMVATTEMNAATSVATMDTYESLGVEQVEWFALDGCEDCEQNAEQGPIPLGDDFPSGDSEPPAHTNCRCCLMPYIEGDSSPIRDQVEQPEDVTPVDLGQPETGGGLTQEEQGFVQDTIDALASLPVAPLIEGEDYTKESLSVAQDLLDKAARVEPAITADMKSFAAENNGELFGLDHRLKTEKSLATKILKDAKDNLNFDLGEAGAGIKDAVRYTMLFTEDTYTADAARVLDSLDRAGYERIKVKNNWSNDGYKGINLQLRSPDGQPMELQLHTPRGIYTKEVISHPMYKERDKLIREQSGSPLIAQLEDKIAKAWRDLRIPAGATTLGKMVAVAKYVARRLLAWK